MMHTQGHLSQIERLIYLDIQPGIHEGNIRIKHPITAAVLWCFLKNCSQHTEAYTQPQTAWLQRLPLLLYNFVFAIISLG